MTAVHASPAAARRRPGTTALLGTAVGLVVADAVVGITTGAAAAAPLPFTSFVVAMVGITLVGARIVHDPLHAGLGGLLLGVAAAGSALDLIGALQDLGPLAFLQGLVYWGYAGLLAHVLVRWPDERIRSRGARLLVLAVYLLLPLLTLTWQLAWDPRWYGREAADRWWPTVVPAQAFAETVWQLQELVFLVVLAALVTVVVVRVVRAEGDRRVGMLPVVAASVVLAITVVLELVEALWVPLPLDTVVLQNLALLTIPVGVWIAALRTTSAGAPAPGRRPPPGDPIVLRYRIGVATVVAGVVVLGTLIVVGTAGTASGGGSAPAPAPGPALVAP